MKPVEEIIDDDHELVVDRVCAVDVAKSFGVVCVRRPAEQGVRRVSRVWRVEATTRRVAELAAVLVEQGVQKVTVESTSDYWRIWFYLLQAADLDVQLVNAREVKNVPGRTKSDKKDAVWLAKLTEKGLLRPSMVPPAPVRVLREYTRLRVDLTRDRTRYWQRLEKLLEDALIKVSSVASRMNTVSTRAMVEALIAGERDPVQLAGLARGRMRDKHSALVQALDGRFEAHHGELARLLLDQIDALDARIDQVSARIEQLVAELPDIPLPDHGPDGGPDGGSDGGSDGRPRVINAADAVERIAEITGLSPRVTHTVLAETGWDMRIFPTAGHLTSWARVTPISRQSGTTTHPGKTGKGNPYLKGALGQAAATAARSHTFLGARYRRLVKRRGKRKALVAVARSILVIIWHLLSDPDARYHDLGPDHYTSTITKEKLTRSHVRQLQALGYRVTLDPA